MLNSRLLDALASLDFKFSVSQSVIESTFEYSMSYIYKAFVSTVNLGYLEPILVHPTRHQNFACKMQNAILQQIETLRMG